MGIRIRKFHRTALATALVFASVILVASPSNAATGPGGSVITCTISFQDPHGSTHVGGTNNVVISTSCTSPVDVVRTFVTLYDYTNVRNKTGGSTAFNTRSAAANAALSCIPGTYQGQGEVDITFPSGFTPAVTSTTGAGRALYLTCSPITFASAPPLVATLAPTAPIVITASKLP